MPIEPTNRDGILSYLSSGDFPGIGPKTAERIFDMFGEKTYEIMDEDPEQFLKVKGIGKKQLI